MFAGHLPLGSRLPQRPCCQLPWPARPGWLAAEAAEAARCAAARAGGAVTRRRSCAAAARPAAARDGRSPAYAGSAPLRRAPTVRCSTPLQGSTCQHETYGLKYRLAFFLVPECVSPETSRSWRSNPSTPSSNMRARNASPRTCAAAARSTGLRFRGGIACMTFPTYTLQCCMLTCMGLPQQVAISDARKLIGRSLMLPSSSTYLQPCMTVLHSNTLERF